MSKKSDKLLFFSLENEDEEEQSMRESKLGNEDRMKESLKYGGNKFGAYQIGKNMLKTADEDYYIQPDTNLHSKRTKANNSIKFIREQFLNIGNQDIQSIYKENNREQSSSQLTIINELDKVDKLEKIKEINPQSQFKDLRKKKDKNIQNLLFNGFDQSSQQQQNIAKQQQQVFQQQTEQQNSQENISNRGQEDEQQEDCRKAIFHQQTGEESGEPETKKQKVQQMKETISLLYWDPQTTKEKFAFRKLGENERIFLVINRIKSGMNYFLPQFDLIFSSDRRHVVSCKKQSVTKFEYHISFDNYNFSEKNNSFYGKIVGNFSNSVFNIIDCYKNSIVCTTRFREDENITYIAPLSYEVYILNENQSYFNLVGADEKLTVGLDQLYMIPVNKKKISYYRNKKPQYNKNIKAYMLNFNGRVNKGSVKNFILQDSNSGRQILMFGKGQDQSFNLYVSQPLNPILGFCLCIPHFATKVMTK